MAAIHALPASPPTYAMSDEIKHDYPQNPTPLQAHTPPTTDEASHKDDDAASSSSLSDLDEHADLDVKMEDFDDELNRQRFEHAARAGAEAEKHSQIKPHHYEGGVPVFQPTMDEFRGRSKWSRGGRALLTRPFPRLSSLHGPGRCIWYAKWYH